MRIALCVPLLASLIALPARAGDTQAGTTVTWKLTTEESCQTGTKKFPCGAQMPDTTLQNEMIQLKGTCTETKDGKSTWSFVVEQVSVEATCDTGAKAKYDSTKDKECLEGYVRYAALKGATFTASIDSDGTILKCSIEAWPTASDIKIEKGTTVKNDAATLMHDPTPARHWLEILFHTAPAATKEWKRVLNLQTAEEMEMKSDGVEQVSGDNCARIKLETADQPKNAPNKIPRDMFKSGKISFSRVANCALKVDLHGGISSDKSGFGVPAQMRWEADCLKRGIDPSVTKVGPPAK